MPKSSKRFIISDSRLNGQDFRMLTNGVDLDAFEKNPLMLFNHQRPEGVSKDQILPIGHWEDIEINGDELSAVPVFDDKDEFAMAIYHKVEDGHIRMCSAGAEPLETSDDPALLLPGQKKATVTKWRLKEASIVDIGANPGALAVALYSSNGSLIKLSDALMTTLIPNIKMKIEKTTAKVAAEKAAAEAKKASKVADDAKKKAIKLAEEAKKDDDDAKLSGDDAETELAEEPAEEDKDEIIARLTAQVEELEARLKLAEDQVALTESEKEQGKAEQLASKAFTMRKITLAQKPQIIRLALSDYKGTVEYLNSIKAQKSIKDTLALADEEKTGVSAEIEKLSAKSWDELFKINGALHTLKSHAPDVYNAKYKDKFKKLPK